MFLNIQMVIVSLHLRPSSSFIEDTYFDAILLLTENCHITSSKSVSDKHGEISVFRIDADLQQKWNEHT